MARYQHWDSGFIARNRSETDFGLNYYLAGHDAKLVFNYAIIDDETDRGTVENKFTLGVFWRL